MRRLRVPEESERGAVTVILAVLMVALLGFTAIVVDVGLVYSERAQLQNGADAAALGVAQKCAKDLTASECSSDSSLAKGLANNNALDGLSNIQSVVLDKPGGKVTVNTGAQEAGGEANSISLSFANALGIPSAEVGADASARWGSPVAGRTVFPAAFSICQVENRIDGALQRLGLHGGAYANSSCNYGPSGAPVAGGFGWLAQDTGQCGGSIDLATSEGGSSTGNNEPPNCTAVFTKWITEINAGRKPTVLLPVFDRVSGEGSGAVYGLAAFAAFEVAGWKFSGGSEGPGVTAVFHNTGYGSSLDCTGNCRGIIGKFVKHVSLAEGYTLGPVHRYGATVVQMTE